VSELDEFMAGLAVMAERGEAGLAVEADLYLELTTAAGASTTARVTGDGQRVKVEAQRPEVLLAAVDRADVGRVAELLTATGITVAVHGPHGPVATLGAGTSNRLGRAVTGSVRVAPAPRGAVRLVWANRQVRVTVVALSAAVVVAAVGHLRRARPSRDTA
jgi:hypothetical protein